MSEPEPEIYFELSKSILRFCAYRRSLYMEDSCLNIYSNTDFHQAIAGSLFCNAILKWCVLFGADSNEYHWKKIVANGDEFRKKLHQAYSGEDNWVYVQKTFTNARNQAIAHVNDGKSRSVLHQPLLLRAVELFIEELKTITDEPDIINFDTVRFFKEELTKSSIQL